MKFLTGILAFMMSMPVLLLSQTWTLQDSLNYEELTTSAENAYYGNSLDAIPKYTVAADAALKYKKYYDYLYLNARKAECAVYHFEYDSAFTFLQKNDSIFSQFASKLDSTEQYILPRHATSWLYYLNRIGDDRSIIQRSKKLIDEIENEGFGGFYGPYHLTVAQNYLGVALKKSGRLQEAEQVFLEGIKKCIELEDWEQRNAFYKQLGDVAAQQNDFSKSNSFYKRAIETNLELYQETRTNTLAARLTSIYQAISKNYETVGIADSVQYYLKKIEPLITQDSFLYIPYLLQLSDLEIRNNNYSEASTMLQSALRYSRSSVKKNPSQSMILLRMAQIARIQKKLDNAEQLINEAVAVATIKDEFIDLSNGVEILFEKAQILAAQNNKNSGREALQVVLEATTLSNEIRINASTDEDRSFLITKAIPIYHYAIHLLTKTNLSKGTLSKESLALRLIEETKAINLLGAVRGISDLETLSEFKGPVKLEEQKNIALAKQAWQNAKDALQTANESTNMDSLQEALFVYRGDYLQLVGQQRRTSPKSYTSRYTIDTSIFDQMLSSLAQDDASVLSFVWTRDTVYALYADADVQKFYACGATNEIDNLCIELGTSIKDANKTFDKSKSAQLFERLLSPVHLHLKDNLIIIPDGKLYYFPFEAMMVHGGDGEDLYLIQKHNILYNYSVSIWQSNRTSKSSVHAWDMISFAPTFPENRLMASQIRGNLSPLLFNESEVEGLSQWIENKTLIGEQATKSNFLVSASDYYAIHLATHAQAFDQNPGQSFLAFTGANMNNDSGRLYLSDIYAMQLKAKLVTLSACETGLGPFTAGEGVVSLARAFQYAGADALLTSLWNVNDETTSQIMASFYKHLSKGETKSESLRLSKMEYLEQLNKSNLHPAYWAGFVLFGSDEPLQKGCSFQWIPILLIFAGGFVMLYWNRRNSRKGRSK